MPEPASGRRVTWRPALLAAVLVADAVGFAHLVNGYYGIGRWLFWRYLVYVLLTVFWVLACVAGGLAVLRRALRLSWPLREELVTAFPVGVLLFQVGVFLAGLVHALGAISFVLLPASMLAAGGPLLFARLRRAARIIRRLARDRPRPFHPVNAAIAVAGLFAVALVYFQILAPDTIGFDARWYHLPLAEHYAADGAVRRSPEGWWLSAYPHLASYVFTWAFLLPMGIAFDKIELCLHMEFATFVGMLAAIPIAVRKLVPRAQVGSSWVAFFLFPQVFLYDSNLNGGADHVSALFALPIGFALLRAWPALDVRACLVFAILVSGVLLTKYSAYSILLAPCLALTLRAAWLLFRGTSGRPRSAALAGPFAAVAAGVVLTSSHWLKNLIWYGDPFYPLLRNFFPSSHPWQPDSPYWFKQFMQLMAPAPPGLRGVAEALRATFLFPFEVHDWYAFHRDVPIFGPLFTLTLPCLPFLRARRRLWGTYVAALSAVFLWYLPCHYERYLQTVVPWMAAATAASIVLIVRAGWLARLGLAPLLVLSVVWGGDVYFFPTQNIVNDSPEHVVERLLASGFLHTEHRLRVNAPYGEIGEKLAPGTRLLLHEVPLHVGIGVPSVSDLWQGRISYGRLATANGIEAELRNLGVTHLLWVNGRSDNRDSLAGDIAFYSFVTRYAEHPLAFGELRVAAMPQGPPPPPRHEPHVGYLACDPPYARGVYRLADMTIPVGAPDHLAPSSMLPRKLDEPTISTLDYIVFEPACGETLPESVGTDFTKLFMRARLQVFERQRP